MRLKYKLHPLLDSESVEPGEKGKIVRIDSTLERFLVLFGLYSHFVTAKLFQNDTSVKIVKNGLAEKEVGVLEVDVDVGGYIYVTPDKQLVYEFHED